MNIYNMKVQVCLVRFKRNKNSLYERGVAIARDGYLPSVELIIDKNFKVVKAPIWNFDIDPHEGLLPIEL